MPPRTTGRIARARIFDPRQLALYGSPTDRLLEALRMGVPQERYRRLWRLGQTSECDGYVRGHLGYERERDRTLWDRQKRDFTKAPVPDGEAAPFLIRLSDLAWCSSRRRS